MIWITARLPFGAPGEGPPCIRQRPFAIAGDWHRLPLRVVAPQRALCCMGNLLCMGWFPPLSMQSLPRGDRSNNRLAA